MASWIPGCAMNRPALQVVAGATLVGAALLCAALGSRLAPHDPLRYDARSTLRPPSAAHPFGTDPLGRDVLSQVITGARVSMIAGVISVIVGTTAGTAVGLAAGIARGSAAGLLMRA